MIVKIYCNMMLKDELAAPLAICAVAPFVSVVLIHDTGSKPELLTDLYKTQEFFPNIRIIERKIEDAHGWIASDVDKTFNERAAKPLGDIRREQHQISKDEGADFILICDGDEIFSDGLASKIPELCENLPENKDAIFLPFIDLCHTFDLIRQTHWMGRIFRINTTSIRGNYPFEQHFSDRTNRCLEPYMSGEKEEVLKIPYTSDTACIHHMESLLKPHRKELSVKRRREGILPSVLTDKRYSYFQEKIQKWLVKE